MSNETLSKDELLLVGMNGAGVELRIDGDGDLEIYYDADNSTRYIPSNEVPKLKDWLNKVLP